MTVTTSISSNGSGHGTSTGLGQTFQQHPFTGTHSTTLPIFTSPCRNAAPQLALTYSSGAGNGVFGLGFSLGLGHVQRKHQHGRPTYDARDVFVIEGADDLVPCLHKVGDDWLPVEDAQTKEDDITYDISYYRARTEGNFSRVERWAAGPDDFHWRVRTPDNHLSIYGKDITARVTAPNDDDPQVAGHCYTWLLQEQRDPKGERTVYSYVADDPTAKGGNRHISTISYGPYVDSVGVEQFHFSLHFDYSDRSLPDLSTELLDHPIAAPRLDPSTSYLPGFAINSSILCRRILMTHRYGDEEPFVVRATHLIYDETTIASRLTGCTCYGYGSERQPKATPGIVFGYTKIGENLGFTKLSTADGDALTMPISGFADVYEDGLPALLHQIGSEVFTSRALGNGAYEPPTLMAHQPLGSVTDSNFSLQDLDRTGRLDLVQTGGGTHGYFELRDDGTWEPFVAFANTLTDADTLSAHQVDVTGDGRADMLRVDGGAIYVHPSLGRRGFGEGVPPSKRQPTHIPKLPLAGTTPAQQLVTFANILGDGISHLVRVTSSGIIYWPNLGHGRFGREQTLSLPTGISHPINPKYLRFADVDGMGAVDLIQFGHGTMTLFANLSGNGFGPGQVFDLPFNLGDLDEIRFADVTGSGGACAILSDMSGPQITHWVFDFMAGRKPQLLNLVKSGMGLEHRAEYASSTQFALKDRAEGRAWRTKLPTPVTVVRSTEIADMIGGTVTRSEYHYHDGYYDRAEKEFRGFACVETTHGLGRPDRDNSKVYWAHPDAADLAQSAQSLTREWFFTGDVPPTSGYEHFYRPNPNATSLHHFDVYTSPDDHYTLGPNTPAPENEFRADASDHRQECWRALHGKKMRSEIYDLVDVLAAADGVSVKPMQATEENYTFFCHQPAAFGAPAVISAARSEKVGYHYEGKTSAPMITHSAVLAYDRHDIATHSAEVNYGKLGDCEDGQDATLIVGHIADPFEPRNEIDIYLNGLIHQNRTFELPSDTVTPGKLIAKSDLFKALTKAARGPPRTWKRRFYVTSEGRECRTDGEDIAPQAIMFRSEEAVLPEKLPSKLTAKFSPDLLTTDAKLILKDGFWWAPSSRVTVNMTPDAFYQASSRSDPMGAVTTLEYSDDQLTVRRKTGPSGSWHEFEFDAFCRSISSVTDANGVTVQTRYDALGQTCATTSFGLEDGVPAGDGAILETVCPPVESLAKIIAEPDVYLGRASTVTLYDHCAYATHGTPNWSLKLSRLQSVQDDQRIGATGAGIGIEVTYLDGFGRALQKKTLTEPGDAVLRDPMGALIFENNTPKQGHADPRWHVNGFVVRDNHDHPVLVYQPYFSATFAVETDDALAKFGHPSRLEYDALHRIIRTHTPAKYITRIETSAWHVDNWDCIDTVIESPAYTDKNDASADPMLTAALDAAAKHAATPNSKFFDAAKRLVARKQQITKGVFQTTRHGYDSQGHLRWTAVDRPPDTNQPERDLGAVLILEQEFDMRGALIWSRSATRGETWHLYNSGGENVAVWNSADQCLSCTYDKANRPKDIVLLCGDPTQGAQTKRVLSRTSYHTIGARPDGKNTFGQISEIRDEAGIVTMDAFNIDGATTKTTRTFLADPFTPADWAGSPEMEPKAHKFVKHYNARKDVTSVTYPDGTTVAMTYMLDGQLASQSLVAKDGTSRMITSDAQYSAKGQLSELQLGSSLSTKYIYDDATGFARQYLAIQTKDSGDETLQDLHYTHDPLGHTYCVQTLKGSAAGPVPSTTIYAYDGLAQLVKSATSVGAEQVAQETFTYDLMGNLTSLSRDTGDVSTSVVHAFEEGSNRLLTVIPENGSARAPSYDALGNMTSDGAGSTFEWDVHGRLCRIIAPDKSETLLQYDTDGIKARQVTRDGVDRRYLGDLQIEMRGDSGVQTSRLDFHDEHAHRAVLETITNGDHLPQVKLTLSVTDILSSVQTTIDDTGDVQTSEAYRAYGASDQNEGKDAKHRYSSKEYFAAAELYDYGARFYSPALAQWISPDPIGHGDGFNMYRFVGGNPVSYNDKTGLIRNQVAPAPATTMREPLPTSAWAPAALPATDRHQRLHRTAVNHGGEDRSGFFTYSRTRINHIGLRTGISAKLTRLRLKVPFVRESTRAAFEEMQAGAEAARSQMTDEQKTDLHKATAGQIVKTPVAWAADAVAAGTFGMAKVVTAGTDHLANSFSGNKRIKVGNALDDPQNLDVTRSIGQGIVTKGLVTKGDRGGIIQNHVPFGETIEYFRAGTFPAMDAANHATHLVIKNGDGFVGGHMTTPKDPEMHLPGQVSPPCSKPAAAKSNKHIE